MQEAERSMSAGERQRRGKRPPRPDEDARASRGRSPTLREGFRDRKRTSCEGNGANAAQDLLKSASLKSRCLHDEESSVSGAEKKKGLEETDDSAANGSVRSRTDPFITPDVEEPGARAPGNQENRSAALAAGSFGRLLGTKESTSR